MKSISSFVCEQCGAESAKWSGKCLNCGAWNSLVETRRIVGKAKTSTLADSPPKVPVLLSDIAQHKTIRTSTQFKELDAVLGGGVVPGSVILVAGDPGVGKSTLLLSVIGKMGGVYVAGEESPEQIKLRADRLGVSQDIVLTIQNIIIESIVSSIKSMQNKPAIVVIDSIQTLVSEELEGIAGTVGQIRLCCQKLIELAKNEAIPIFIVGHVTKEGTIAGPKVLEHMVDVVCYFEGERYYEGRILRALKNRFGSTDEVGIFEMSDVGFKEVTNPSKLFLEGRVKNVPGSTVAVTMEGTRPLLVEIQALTVPSPLAMPRRVVNGFDYNRLQVILAILQKRLGLGLGSHDVFVNVSGGVKLKEPATDLPVALAIISAFTNKAIPQDTASFGELGLLGEIRRVQGIDKRIKEAKRLGFEHILYSESKALKNIVELLDLKGKNDERPLKIRDWRES